MSYSLFVVTIPLNKDSLMVFLQGAAAQQSFLVFNILLVYLMGIPQRLIR